LFEEGVEQLRAAADELAQAETRVQTLIERADGTFDLSEPRE
jgi:exonuclease VII small subunit